MDEELRTKLNLFAYKEANKVEDVDVGTLMNLVFLGGKWMYEQMKLKEQNNK